METADFGYAFEVDSNQQVWEKQSYGELTVNIHAQPLPYTDPQWYIKISGRRRSLQLG